MEIQAAKVYYCMATASTRTSHVSVGDIIVGINDTQLFTSPTDGALFSNTDEFFEDCREKIITSAAPRSVRFIRFFRNIYRGRIVAPRDAKLNHVEASFLFNKTHLLPVARFIIGEGEGTEDEDPRLKDARESGMTSVVFDVVFPDEESLGINLWPNLLMWSSALGATDNKPVILNNTKRLRPSEFAGTALSAPPIIRQASSSSSSQPTTTTTPITYAAPSSSFHNTPGSFNNKETSSPTKTISPTASNPSVEKTKERERTESPTLNPWEDIRSAASAAPWVEPLLARHENKGRVSSHDAMLDSQPERFPRPSDLAGLRTNLSVPPIVANAMKQQQQSSPPSTITRSSWSQGKSGDTTSSWSQGRTGEVGTNEMSSPDRRSSIGSFFGITMSTSGAASASTDTTIATAMATVVDHVTSSTSSHTRDDDLQRCYQGQDRLVRPSEMKGTSLSVPPIVGRTTTTPSLGPFNHNNNSNQYNNSQYNNSNNQHSSSSSLPSPPVSTPSSHAYPPPHSSPLMGGGRPRLTRLNPPSTSNQGRAVDGTTETTLTDFDNDDDDAFGLNVNKSLSLSPHTSNNITSYGIPVDGEGSAVDGDHHGGPISDTWKFVGVGNEENTDSSSSSLPLLPTGLTSMSLS